MTRLLIVLGLALGVQATALGQGQPDFSGTWQLNLIKSGRGVSFPSQLVVTQSSTELTVEGTSVRQDPFSAVYTLDGSRIDVEAPSGITETAEANVNGATLVIASRRSFPSPAGEVVVEFRETWSVSGNVLTIEKTATQAGESETASAVYDKA